MTGSYTPAQTADALNVNTTTLRRYEEQGLIPARNLDDRLAVQFAGIAEVVRYHGLLLGADRRRT